MVENMSELIKKSLETIFERSITQQEYFYLLGQYPYIELCDHENPYLDQTRAPNIITADNGWHIFDYGNALFSSGNEWVSAARRKKKQMEIEEEESGSGTIIKQFTDIAFLLIEMIEKKGWVGIDFLGGYYSMLRMAWIAAERKKLKYYHFEPTMEDYVVYHWVDKIKNKVLYPPEKPILSTTKRAIK